MKIIDQCAVLIFEGRSPNGSGDLSIFESRLDAESYLEPVDVNNGEFFGYTLNGNQLFLAVEENRVTLTIDTESGNHHAVVRRLLEQAVKAMPENKREGVDILTASDEQLVQLVGYSGGR